MLPDPRPFELRFDDEPTRIIRGRFEAPDTALHPGPRPLVLIAHGFKGFMNWGFFPELSRRVAHAGLCAVSFNFSGSGVGPDLVTIDDEEAFARDTYTRQLEDLERVRDQARRYDPALVDATRCGLLGHSKGGGVSLLYASEHPELQALVTWAAIDDVDRISEEDKELMRRQGSILFPNARTGQMHRVDKVALDDVEENRERLDILAACERITTPTLVIHGDADPAVDVDGARRIHARLGCDPKELWIVPEAGHTFGGTHPLESIPPTLERVLERSVGHLGAHLAGKA